MNKIHFDSEVRRKISNEEILRLAKEDTGHNFVGVISQSQSIRNIKRSLSFASPSGYYGHRYRKNTLAIWDGRESAGFDLFCTDKYGILKNSICFMDSRERVRIAKKGWPVVFIFGGSTVMGVGSKIPEFTIPSILESLSFKNLVCINYGLGGTCSKEALNLMIDELDPDYKPDIIIFYDGWNCASYLTESFLMTSSALRSEQNLYAGITEQMASRDRALMSAYSIKYVANRLLKLIGLHLIDLIPKFLGERECVSKILCSIENKYLNLKKVQRSNSSYASEHEIALAVAGSVEKYNSIHNFASSVCESADIKFLHILQPLIFVGNKKLSCNENIWRKNGFSSGNPLIYESFYREVMNNDVCNSYSYLDLSDCFNDIDEEVYIDSGHLNRIGNLIVGQKINLYLNEKGLI